MKARDIEIVPDYLCHHFEIQGLRSWNFGFCGHQPVTFKIILTFLNVLLRARDPPRVHIFIFRKPGSFSANLFRETSRHSDKMVMSMYVFSIHGRREELILRSL